MISVDKKSSTINSYIKSMFLVKYSGFKKFKVPLLPALLTKFTAIIATLFIICSIAIVAISRDELRETQSVLEKQEEENSNLPQIPQSK